MNIRKATAKDLKAVQKLNKMLFDKEIADFDPTLNSEWSFGKDGTSYFKKRIAEGSVFVAVDNKSIVGYLAGGIEKLESWRTIKKLAVVESMFVLEEYRSQGIGKQLFNEFIKWCKSKKIKRIKVVASAQNTKGIEFYRKNGFKDYDLTLETDI